MFDLFKKMLGWRLLRNTKTVGSALVLETGHYNSVLADAVAAIDSVHSDGALPSITVKRETLHAHGTFSFNRKMEAVGIRVHHSTNHPELTLAHEIRHFLDVTSPRS